MIWNPTGTAQQILLVKQALNKCDFPFDLLLPSLKVEGKSVINVGWGDISRTASSHEHGIHSLEVRGRTLGLFYLPPNTKIMLDLSLVTDEVLAHEVFLSEAAHAVDYHYMTNAMRLAFWNAIHSNSQDLTSGTIIVESGDLGHGHSWFDGLAGYGTWVGEAWMEGFVRSFSPSVPITIGLAHPTPRESIAIIRNAILPPQLPTYTKEEKELAAALRRAMWLPKYLRTAANNWLNSKKGL